MLTQHVFCHIFSTSIDLKSRIKTESSILQRSLDLRDIVKVTIPYIKAKNRSLVFQSELKQGRFYIVNFKLI